VPAARRVRVPETMKWLEEHRTPIVLLLLFVTLAGVAVFLYRQFALPHFTEVVIEPPGAEIQMYVEGEVVTPGVYELRDGALVADAVEAAGGFAVNADRGAINLADRVRDGDHIHVYGLGEVPQRVNINTAEPWLLEALPGVGETLAARIVDYRSRNGPFHQTEDLKQVEGVGPALFEKLKDRITVY